MNERETHHAENPAKQTKRGMMLPTVTFIAGLASLVVAGSVTAWVAGSLGISTAAASQIVAAIEVGGVALAIVGAVFGAGIVGAIIATVRYMLVRKARSVVIA